MAPVSKLVAVYKASSAVEAHCVGQLLDEAGIDCRIEGVHLESIYGIGTGWTMPNVLVFEEDLEVARQLIADQLKISAPEPPPKRPLRYGMKSLLINMTLIAIILGFYAPLGAQWSAFALAAFQFLVAGNVLAFAYASRKRHRIMDERYTAP